MKKKRSRKIPKRKSPNAAVIKELRTLVEQMRHLSAAVQAIRSLMPTMQHDPRGPTGIMPPRPIVLPHNFFVPPTPQGIVWPR